VGRDPCLGLALVGDVVWVPACGDGVLVAVDTSTLRVRRRLPLPLDSLREGFITASAGSLWVPVRLASDDSLSRGLARVDAATGRLVATIALSAMGRSGWRTTSTTGSGGSRSQPSAASRPIRVARPRSAEPNEPT